MTTFYKCCEHCNWPRTGKAHLHIDTCSALVCRTGHKRERGPVAPKLQEEVVSTAVKDFTRYNEREVELTRDDEKVFVGKAIVAEGKVTIFTGRRGRPPVVAVEHIKKIRLAA